ncbi:MAG: AarF/UbiB family protein, partial [bacterium]
YCSSSIIVMEKFEGYKIKHLGKEYELSDDDRKIIAENGARVFWKQVFLDGFFHADLHSGNIIFMSDHLIGLIDCGLAGKLNPYLKEKTAEMFVAMATKDYLKLASVCIELNKGKKPVDRKTLSLDMKALLDALPDSLGDMNSAKLMNDILNIVRKNYLKLPSELLRLAKAVSLVEGFGKTLYPDFNIIDESRDMASAIIREQYSPERLLDDAVKIISHLREMSITLPINLSEILEKIERGNLRLKLDLTIRREEKKFLSKMVTRICMAFIVTGSMLSMSLFKDGSFFYFSMAFFIFFLLLFFISFRKG